MFVSEKYFMQQKPLLAVENLSVAFTSEEGLVRSGSKRQL
jgi:hypothetical protein